MQFVVLITDRKINTRYVLEHENGARTAMGIEQRSPDLDETYPEELGRFTASDLAEHWNIFFAKTEEEAKVIANEMSSANPNKNVFWAKLIGAFESVPSKPIEKSVTEKGLLPV